MDQRLRLQVLLENTLGSRNVYFQPPADFMMKYPCIVYERDDEWAEHASNALYTYKKRYQVTVIDRNPDSEIPDKIRRLPYCGFARHFVTENLNHDIFNLYF